MERIKIAICDDEVIYIERLKKIINEVFADSSKDIILDDIVESTDGEAFTDICASNNFDVVFLDIAIGELDGFLIAKKIYEKNKDTLIVFMSGYTELICNSCEHHPYALIAKSIFEQQGMKVVERLLKHYCDFVELMDKYGHVYRVNKRNISAIEADGHYTIIYNSDGTEIRICSSFSAITSVITGYEFLMIHKSICINKNYVSAIDKERDSIELCDKQHFPVSRRKRGEVYKELGGIGV